MEIDVTKVALGIAAVVIGGGAGGFGTNRVNETSAAEERQVMREMHAEAMDDQREECSMFVERCVSLCAGEE